MKKNLPIHLQEIIFGSSDSAVSKQISKLEKNGTIRKLAPRIYSSNLIEDAESIIRRNLFSILGHLYPGSVLSHRSAFEFKPTSLGHVFLTYKYTKKGTLPGITIRLLEGGGPVENDNLLSGELYASQQPRAFLENLQVSRKAGPNSKTLPLAEIEKRLEEIVRVHGEDGLNKVRDQARSISKKLSMEKEFSKLNQMISALLTTHPSKILRSPIAAARAFGVPFDPARIELFEILFRALQQQFKYRDEQNTSPASFRNFAFFESYFSNYIEGTVFEVEEAKEIIQSQKPLPTRNEDSHDVLGTYQIVSNHKEMEIVPENSDHLIEILKYRHQVILRSRVDKNLGTLKDRNNFAGQSSFVDASLVKGTLLKSFDYYQALDSPFSRAIYQMFVVSEIHPFLDGNGRIARVMMNAELVNGGQSKIIIPTVYRDDYLGALRKLTRQRDPDAYIRMLSRAHEFSDTIVGEGLDEMQVIFENSNAFKDHTEAKLMIQL
ncbi:MAG: cell filamentation protein Fic [Cytophagales bacterium]|nr:cell filamentation protein Fic [Cytophagales bacterium]